MCIVHFSLGRVYCVEYTLYTPGNSVHSLNTSARSLFISLAEKSCAAHWQDGEISESRPGQTVCPIDGSTCPVRSLETHGGHSVQKSEALLLWSPVLCSVFVIAIWMNCGIDL